MKKSLIHGECPDAAAERKRMISFLTRSGFTKALPKAGQNALPLIAAAADPLRPSGSLHRLIGMS